VTDYTVPLSIILSGVAIAIAIAYGRIAQHDALVARLDALTARIDALYTLVETARGR
jgi:hypothetical protein